MHELPSTAFDKQIYFRFSLWRAALKTRVASAPAAQADTRPALCEPEAVMSTFAHASGR
jgi:hypothetical protein